MRELAFERCSVKKFTCKIGSTQYALTMVADLGPKIARDLGIHSVVMATDNTPKQEFVECELACRVENTNVTLEVASLKDWLHIPQCEVLEKFVAKRKGATKKGKPSKLRIQFDAHFRGNASGVFEWLEKYGAVDGTLKVKLLSEQQDFFAATNAAPKAPDNKKGKAREASNNTSPTWPQANEHGVYKGAAEVIELRPLGKNQSHARIKVLQVGPDQWASAYVCGSGGTSVGDGGTSTPLSTVTGSTREEAIRSAAGKVRDYAAAREAEVHEGKVRARWLIVKDWAQDLLSEPKARKDGKAAAAGERAQ